MTKATSVPPRVAELSAALSQPKPMRRGSINQRLMKCGHSNCACQKNPKARHGPYYTLTQAVGGQTRSRYVREDHLPALHRQIEAGRRFRQAVEDFWDACEQWADTELERTQGAAEAPEKGGFPRASKARSAKRSKRW